MEKLKLAFTGLLAFSLFCLTAAIFYFAGQISEFNRQVPLVAAQVQATRNDLPGIMDRIEALRQDLPAILAAVDTASGAANNISSEIARIRPAVPQIIDASEKIRETVDKSSEAMLSASAAVENVRPMIPQILEESKQIRGTADKAASAVNHFSSEMGKVTPMVPDVLAELQKTREAIPEYLDRTDKLVRNAQKLSSKKTSGAVKGFVSGVIETPFLVAGTVRDSVKSLLGMEDNAGLTENDLEKVNASTIELLEAEKPAGTALNWENPDTKITGSVTYVNPLEVGGQACKKLRYEIYRNDKRRNTREIIFCRQPDGSWMELMENNH